MTTISDLPRDLVERILSRVPLTSMRSLRFTCKRWDTISKDPGFVKLYFGKAAAARQLILMSQYRVWLMSVNLHGDGDDDEVKGIGKLTSLNNSDQVEMSNVFHCNGLLLCVTKDKPRLVVWNPYLGQTRWIEPRNDAFDKFDVYALGYDKNLGNQKILRFLDRYDYEHGPRHLLEYEIFDLKSNSWRVLDVTPHWVIRSCQSGVSLKGNTYFFARPMEQDGWVQDFLICYDFTRERFGPRLALPLQSDNEVTVTLSSVREEQLVVLYQRDTGLMEIWVTNKIESNVVSWSKAFLAVSMEPLIGHFYLFPFEGGSFFIDEEKKIAVVFDKDKKEINNRAYLIGENGYYKEVDLGYLNRKNGYQKIVRSKLDAIFPLVCSYSPSSVKIQQGARGKRKERDY